MKNTTYEFDEKNPVIPLVNSKLQTYTRELCHALGMKAFKVVQVHSRRNDYFSFYRLGRDTGDIDIDFVNGMVLTHSGLINAVIWIGKVEGRETYFYSTGYGILDKGNRYVMKSVNLRPLLRKIKDNRLPIDDFRILNDSQKGNTLFDNVTNLRSVESNIRRVSLSGKSLHCVLELAKSASPNSTNKHTNTSYDYDSDMATTVNNKLSELDDYYKQLCEGKSRAEETLTKHFYMICHSSLHDDDECVVVRGSLQQTNGNIDGKRITPYSLEHCRNLQDFSNYRDIEGLLTVYKTIHENELTNQEDKNMRLNNLINVSGYGSNTYDEDVQIFVNTCRAKNRVEDNSTSDIHTVFVLNVEK